MVIMIIVLMIALYLLTGVIAFVAYVTKVTIKASEGFLDLELDRKIRMNLYIELIKMCFKWPKLVKEVKTFIDELLPEYLNACYETNNSSEEVAPE